MTQSLRLERYTRTAVVLHWLIAILILGNLILALVSANSAGPLHRTALDLHKSVGFSVLLLSLVRLAWRLYRPPPPMREGKAWERAAAEIVHVAFYFLMVLIPVLGWVVSSGAKTRHAINVLGWHAPFLPVMSGKQFTGPFMDTHRLLGFTMAALLILHIGAALKHRFLDKDGVLGRMSLWPRRSQIEQDAV
ncbi:cytochrome b [Caulobacter sp. LARHSG274]